MKKRKFEADSETCHRLKELDIYAGWMLLVEDAVGKVLMIDNCKVKITDSLTDDLGMDSMDQVDLVQNLIDNLHGGIDCQREFGTIEEILVFLNRSFDLKKLPYRYRQI